VEAAVSHQGLETIRLIFEWTAVGIEVLAVAVIVAGVVILAVRRDTVRDLFASGKEGTYEHYRQSGCYWGWIFWSRRM
jgi:hypothetical protein